MNMTAIKEYMAKVDYGQTIHRASNYLIVGLISIVIYFVKKADDKLDKVVDKVQTHEAAIQVHTNQISNINQQLGRIEQKQELHQRGL